MSLKSTVPMVDSTQLQFPGSYNPVTLYFVLMRRKALHDKAMLRQTSTYQCDAPGKDTGRPQGHLSSYLVGGAPWERHRAICKSDSKGCDAHGGGLDERPTQTLRTGQETHRATVGSPGQTGNATVTRDQLVEKKPDGKEPRNTHDPAASGDRSRPADVRTHEEREGLPPFADASKQRRPVGSKTGMGKHTHGHTLTHRSTRRETDAHKTRA
jgi:hypothetical protein